MRLVKLTILRPIMNIARFLRLDEQIFNSIQKQFHILVNEGLELNDAGHCKSAGNRSPQPSVCLVISRSEHCWLLLAPEDWQCGLHHIRLSYQYSSVYLRPDTL